MFKKIADMVGFNHSVFSGAMDVIAIKDKNGEIRSTSFHVRFGSFKVLKSKTKLIQIYTNNIKTNVTMKLSSSGDAYFTLDEIEPQNTFQDINKQYNVEEENNKNIEVDDEDSDVDNSAPVTSNKKYFLASNCLKDIVENSNKGSEVIEEIFLSKIISEEDFKEDPWNVLNNKNVVYYYDGNLLSQHEAIPLAMSLLIFNKPLPEETMTKLEKHSKKKFSLSFKNKKKLAKLAKIKITNSIDNEDKAQAAIEKANSISIEKMKKKYRSFFPSSNQLQRMNLQIGRNEITFECANGTKLKCDLYLWSSDSKIVISDIDGTITRSDVLGQLMPMIGKDWSHKGITELYTNIFRNGYKFVYLTARAICQSGTTKDYLNSLFIEEKGLPRGPLLMSPDGLFSSFKREVIDKEPHLLKISVLKEVRAIFPADYSPFYAGFGNRDNDSTAYQTVGIETGRIFIVNNNGEVTQLNNSMKKSYSLINNLVHDIFPFINSSFG